MCLLHNPFLTSQYQNFKYTVSSQSECISSMMASTEPVNEEDKALTLETPLMTHWGTLTADRVIEYLLKKKLSLGQLPFHWNIWTRVMANNSHRYTKVAICLPHKGIKHTSPARAISVPVPANTWGLDPMSAGAHINCMGNSEPDFQVNDCDLCNRCL